MISSPNGDYILIYKEAPCRPSITVYQTVLYAEDDVKYIREVLEGKKEVGTTTN